MPNYGATVVARYIVPLQCRFAASGQQLLLSVGVVFYVDRFIHRGGCGVGFFVSCDFGFVLERRPYIVETFKQNFLARRRQIRSGTSNHAGRLMV